MAETVNIPERNLLFSLNATDKSYKIVMLIF